MSDDSKPPAQLSASADARPAFDFIVESINDSILVCDEKGTIVYVNHRFAELVAGDREELSSGEVTIFDVVTDQGAQVLREKLARRKEDDDRARADWDYELEVQTNTGEVRHCLVTTTPIRGADDRYTGTIAALTDITQRIRAREALAKVHDELDKRVRERTDELEREVEERRDAERRARQVSRAKSKFLANMTHELRTPLNAIIGYTELIREDLSQTASTDEGSTMGAEGTATRRDLGRIQSSADHLLDIIDDILALAQVETGELDVENNNVDVEELVREAAGRARARVPDNKLVIRVENDVEGSVIADRRKLARVLDNLLENAITFTDDGHITIVTREIDVENGPALKIDVSDTGCGIAPEDVERLFEPVTLGDDSSSQIRGGTGLGLTICRHFVELMGGRIEVDSQPGVGSTFSIILPAIDASAGTTVLLIDDDRDTHELMRRFLVPRGYRVVSAYSGSRGLEYARELEPDVIAIDVTLPSEDGWSLVAQIKSDQHIADIPIIIMSMIDDRSVGYSLGATDFVVKPIQRQQLSSTLANVTSGVESGHVLVVEDDPDTRDIVTRHLERSMWSVDCVTNGRRALEFLNHLAPDEMPDVVLLDLMLPEIDGFEVADKMRTHAVWREIPIVVLTSVDLNARDRSRLRLSVERVLQKGSQTYEEVIEEIVSAAD